jgi:glycerate kinase
MLEKAPTILVVPDSFKGCLPAADVAAAMAQGVALALGAHATIIQLPFADGGEGTLDALTAHWAVAPQRIDTVDAVGRPRVARYGLSSDGTTGIIEAAEANGLPHVADLPPQPMRADSLGAGIIARELLDRGVDEILLCIGGSASTDGGTGILRALGASFLDSAGNEVQPGGGGLAHIYEIDDTKLHPRARQVMWRIATDVDNPLCGKHGAAEVFGPQKGASSAEVAALDAGLAQLAKVLDEKTGMDVSGRAGTGAAGGIPACLVPLLGAEMVPGAELVADVVGLPALAERADLILTGEGSFDAQSLRGKVVQGVLRAAPAGVPVVVIAGSVGLTASESRAAGVTAAFSIATGPSGLAGLTRDASSLIRDSAAHVSALFTKSCLHR